MSEDRETMLVRLQGGDVVRRPIAARTYDEFINGDRILLQEEPELNDDEMVVRTMADKYPLIVKTR